ncbi:MAG: hypothetical protein NT107_02310 [Planctomycetota bacterium]|nr:hypothetical protein [Planctomycetota bacterium]
MNTCRHFLLGLFVLGLVGCTETTMRIDVGAAFTSVNGNVALQNSAGSLVLDNVPNNFDRGLGLGETEASPYVGAEANWGAHRLKTSGFYNKATGAGTLENNFGDLPANSAVTTSFDFYDLTTSYTYNLLPRSVVRLGIGIQLGIYWVDLDVDSPGGFERINSISVAPMPCLETELDLGNFSLGASGGGIKLNYSDADMIYWDAEAHLRFVPIAQTELILGYRYIKLDGNGVADGRDFESDFVVSGLFVGGGIHF